MNTLGIVIIIIIILAAPHYYYYNHYNKGIPQLSMNNLNLRTGDVILFKYETPMIYSQKNGLNTSFFLGKFIMDGLAFYLQGGIYYTHAGIIIIINNKPYIWHLTDDPHFDEYTQQVQIGTPSLCDIQKDGICGYRGVPYLVRYNGPEINFPTKLLDKVYKENIHIQGEFFKCIITNGLGLGNNEKSKYMCLDFVEMVLFNLGLMKSFNRKSDFNNFLNNLTATKYYDVKDVSVIKNAWFSSTGYSK
jgi:hypothetical protein